MTLTFVPVLAVLALIALDQTVKRIVFDYLQPVAVVPFIDGFMDFCYVENKGAAFGIFQGGRWFFVLMTLLVVFIIGFYYVRLPRRKPYGWVRASMVLIMAGAVGNGVDRMLFGYVIDFIRVRFIEFPVFNLADIYLCTGTFLLAVLMIFFVKSNEAARV